MLLGLCLGLMASASHAATKYVDASRPDDSGAGTNWPTAKQTIQAAVDLAGNGDLVLVTNGVYNKGGKAETAGTTLTNRVYSGAGITIQAVSTNPADTVIVGAPDPGTGSHGPAAIRGYKGPPSSWLIGFTISNGYTFATGGTDYKDRYGGGVYGGNVSNCVIVGNSAKDYGGGAAYGKMYRSIVKNNTAANGGGGAVNDFFLCVISNNTAAGLGGGIYNASKAYNSEIVNNTAPVGGAMSTDCTASNCVIRGNTSTSYGAVAGFSQTTSHKFYNCLIVSNVGAYGAIYQRAGGTGTLINCTMVDNRSTNASGARCAGLVGMNGTAGGSFVITNSIIRFNVTSTGSESNHVISAESAVGYSCMWPSVTGQAYDKGGNISANPVFKKASADDFRLVKGSPGIDQGCTVPLTNDLLGVNRPQAGTYGWTPLYDMGAYEFVPGPSVGTVISIQ